MPTLYNTTDEHDACGVGFVARLSGVPSHQVISDALTAMARLAHRGGHAAGDNSGDGAGLLMPLPKTFFMRQWPQLQHIQQGAVWAVGQLFLPPKQELRDKVLKLIRESLEKTGFSLVDGRELPLSPEVLADSVRVTMPTMLQILVCPTAKLAPLYQQDVTQNEGEGLERALYIARRRMEKSVQAWLTEQGHDPKEFYVVSLSSRSIIYKGMLPGARLGDLYLDLVDTTFTAPFAIFHERFSTNTLPSWRLAQPFRHIAHNGEINTVRANAGRMLRREPQMLSSLFGDDLQDIFPIIDPSLSDSAQLDSALEILVRSGRSLPHALMMLIPEPFGATFVMGDNKRAFYEYHAALMDAWDGPTALVFTNGYSRVGAMLDRNGLRPCRYTVSHEGMVMLASETGVMDVDPERVAQRGQLRPRRMLMVDVERGRLVPDAEIKGHVIREKPYRRWLKQYGITLADIMEDDGDESRVDVCPPNDLERVKVLFGYDSATLKNVILPMARDSQEPVGSMGADVPLAVLDERPGLLFSYFKQQFAQVTNPPIDPLREDLSMSLMNFAGRERNILEPQPESCDILRLPHPFLTREQMRHLRMSTRPQVCLQTLDATFPVVTGDAGQAGIALGKALDQLFVKAEEALEQGVTILVISDAAANAQKVPMPSLLALAGLHHYLRSKRKRHLCGIIVETGEACQVMHMALLSAYGASAICPYAALDIVKDMAEHKRIANKLPHQAEIAYIAALKKGMLKAFARLGISTQRSFRSGQYFEAVGIQQNVVDTYFVGTRSRIGGIGLDEMAADAYARHAQSCAADVGTTPKKDNKVLRLWTNEGVRALRKAVCDNDKDAYATYAATSDVQEQPITLRSLFVLQESAQAKPIPLEEVESAQSIVTRFVGAAMSFGSLSREAHETIATGCNMVGARSNCGEGGEDPRRDTIGSDNIDKRSRVRQVASGRFGVTATYLAHADEIQIKVAQGAKPGEGGQLPAHKVTAEIAAVRGTTPGVSLVSPPPHHDIYSIEDLAQLIFDLKKVQPTAKISVKLVSEAGVGTVAVGVVKAGAHQILISGHDGGTGASPLSAIYNTGLPWEMGLLEAHEALLSSGLRHKVVLRTDGLLRTGRDLLIAFMLGAEECSIGTSMLVSLGCVLCRQCHKGKCSAGIATQDKALRQKFAGKPEHIARLFFLMAEDLRQYMAACGLRTVNDVIGRADMLCVREDIPSRAALLDLKPLLYSTAQDYTEQKAKGVVAEDHDLMEDTHLEKALLEYAAPLLEGKSVRCTYIGTIMNTDRAIGSRLAGDMARLYKNRRMPQHSYSIKLFGSAGQSLGAFLTSGLTMTVRGDANDYVGKGLSGGIVVVAPARECTFDTSAQAIVGNVALYGATSGEAYFCGTAGERFAVRNSGAMAVVEGLGDHGCEYMTGGTVVVLGECGYNFAAGMSGGMAFVYDRDERFQNRCNTDSVDLESIHAPEDCSLLRSLVEQHHHYTGSLKAEALLKNWDAELPLFVKVMPLDYREALLRQRNSSNHNSDTLAATEEVYLGDTEEE